ncbi:cleft lip and palate transmembrane protein 1 [Culex quinquefasciatus]|uniref:Cleft lip and palate transmembrane protein 1 n=1 Tax=Culex quinquefasciatus TaxID=7176 RepID=B0W5N9_CULQU|nr:cleft lip and palate transmembrane protein 1 [Culex quinquefasciatus]|eukprot:XP_001844023.1 cleft lip and palate transmembrane protein 1 [Culex quinquefasciatus]
MPGDNPAEGEPLVAAPAGDGQQVADAAAANRQPSRMESFFAITKSLILRALVIYFISSFFRKPAPDAPVNQVGGDAKSRITAWNLFDNGTMFDLYVYVSDDPAVVNFSDPSALVWLQEDLMYGDWYGGRDGDGIFTINTQIKASERLMNNGSIFLHTYVTRAGKSPNPDAGEDFAGKYMGYASGMLSKYKKIKRVKTHNLLAGEKEKFEKELDNALVEDRIVSHWHPNLTINLVTDQTNWVKGSVPPPLDEYIKFLPGGQTYLPIVFYNDYWNMLREYQPINETTPVLDLNLSYQPLSLFKWQLYAAQAMRNKWTNNIFGEALTGGGQESDEDQDSLKETLLETNPYLLGITIAVSILHSIFELLAFKNDIQFWNNRKSLEGLSVRSVFFNVFQSLIVLLYVLDNETNFMIKMSCFVGLGIEVWKIQKVVNISITRENLLFGFLPRITFSDKGSYVESSTKQYDNLAFKYLSWLCFPLLVAYGIYSVIYQDHKGWYSFILNMLYGFLLTFGFIMMTPQLFINYKLKSVAHLPWRMMSYKFLNTFIDDIFAFVIKMPTMYRIGCFRDDIVFFIFLYQRWIYKVDSKRINEFGFSAEMLEEQQLGKQTPGGALTAGPAATTAETQNNSSAASSDEAKSQPSSPNATKKRKNRKSKANKSAAEKKDD